MKLRFYGGLPIVNEMQGPTRNTTLAILIACIVVSASFLAGTSFALPLANGSKSSDLIIHTVAQKSSPTATSVLDYSPTAAVNYAWLVNTLFFHTAYYPSGLNNNTMQKNLDHFNSEDCAHFVSEALIAGGLTILAQNPPGDNLTTYDNGLFVGSYGIVGAYRLADYLAGYDLPVFPVNATVENTLGYQPLPASYAGSPRTAVYYLENYSLMPSYYLSPGDVIIDGGAGSGHAMIYVGGGKVVQTDPAASWTYQPGVDWNISFYGLATLDGQNVTALYMHMPTFSGNRIVNITALSGSGVLNQGTARLSSGKSVYLIGSFPRGVGYGKYSFTWLDNGALISRQQNFSFTPHAGVNHIELYSNGSQGSAVSNYTITTGPHSNYSGIDMLVAGVIVAGAASVSLVLYARRRKRD